MALPLKRTLGDLRAELQTRLGFGMSGQAGIVNSPIIDSLLRSAQEQLYWQFEWRALVGAEERTVGVDQRFCDYPPDCNIEQITLVAAWNGGEWRPLEEGIGLRHRNAPAGGWPLRYERLEQMELWPVPQSPTRLRREFVRALAPFSHSDDRASLPDEIVFLLALANAKAHYRQPDAERYEKQVEALFARMKAKNRGQSVWTRDARPETEKDRYYSYPRV